MNHRRMRGVSHSKRRGTPAGVGGATLILPILLLLSGGTAHAQERSDPDRVTITGRVLDEVTRSPVEGVRVYFVELDLIVHTDGAGEFEVKDMRRGDYQLELTRQGYRSTAGDFLVDRGGAFVVLLTPVNSDGDVLAGRFVGRVTDGESDEPLSGVAVRLNKVRMDGITNDAGRFAMPAVPPGRYAVEFASLGYATRVDTVDIVAGQTTDAQVRLALDPLDIEPIEVTVEARELILEEVGFYQRRSRGFGQFIDRAVIEDLGPHKITDLFAGLPGVSLVFVPPTGQAVLLRQRCLPTIVLDGQVMDPVPGHQVVLIDDYVSPDVVAGIEIFASSAGVPIQYRGDSCGVILIWTRR